MDAAVVTTNGIIKNNGCAVMSAGIAKFARDTFTEIDRKLGNYLRTSGNHAYYLGHWLYKNHLITILTMPTKHDWRNDSDINLIKQSAIELVALADKYALQHIFLPCPCCSNGHLDYEKQVKPVIQNILDDRFIVIINKA